MLAIFIQDSGFRIQDSGCCSPKFRGEQTAMSGHVEYTICTIGACREENNWIGATWTEIENCGQTRAENDCLHFCFNSPSLPACLRRLHLEHKASLEPKTRPLSPLNRIESVCPSRVSPKIYVCRIRTADLTRQTLEP